MRVWMVRFLSREAIEFYRLFQDQEDALVFLRNPDNCCVPIDSEPQTVSPEELLDYMLHLKMFPS